MFSSWAEGGAEYVRGAGCTPEPILAGRGALLAPMLRRGRKLVEAFAGLVESHAAAVADGMAEGAVEGTAAGLRRAR